jgi:hydrogenase/urease accessory protein HupE
MRVIYFVLYGVLGGLLGISDVDSPIMFLAIMVTVWAIDFVARLQK